MCMCISHSSLAFRFYRRKYVNVLYILHWAVYTFITIPYLLLFMHHSHVQCTLSSIVCSKQNIQEKEEKNRRISSVHWKMVELAREVFSIGNFFDLCDADTISRNELKTFEGLAFYKHKLPSHNSYARTRGLMNRKGMKTRNLQIWIVYNGKNLQEHLLKDGGRTWSAYSASTKILCARVLIQSYINNVQSRLQCKDSQLFKVANNGNLVPHRLLKLADNMFIICNGKFVVYSHLYSVPSHDYLISWLVVLSVVRLITWNCICDTFKRL